MGAITRETVLILENEPIVAMELEGTLADADFDVISQFGTCHEALRWLRDHDPDLVVLDIHLNDGSCAEVAELLVARETPFVVFSASTPQEGATDDVFLKGTWVPKPSNSEEVVAALRGFDRRAA